MTVEEIEASCDTQDVTASVPHPLDVGTLPLCATFYPLGFALEVRTNSAEVLEMYKALWPERRQRYHFAPMLTDVYVEDVDSGECPPVPSYCYQRPIFTSVADAQHHVVMDVERRKTWMSLTSASLRHRLYLESFFLLVPLGTFPVSAIHAACVTWNGHGVLLCGDSGAGKSTLAYACARAGWDYVSDDMCLLIDGPRRLVAGNSHLVRLRPTAAELFPEIRGLPLSQRATGKPTIELSTFPMNHVCRRDEARIDSIVFINRRQPGPSALVPYRKDVARLYMSQGLYGSAKAERRHAEAVDHLLDTNVFELRYPGGLDWAIERLRELAEEGR